MRGNQFGFRECPGCVGSIPACAGEPVHLLSELSSLKVYPRVCGGTVGWLWSTLTLWGLSPRVRGNPPPPPPHALEQVYPRVCGGTTFPQYEYAIPNGLSPRVRGNRPGRTGIRRRTGSIPACAGEPHSLSMNTLFQTVYPRVCGGTQPVVGSFFVSTGLSPRVRGNRRSESRGHKLTRSIPACAGEPSIYAPMSPHSRVYPRVCGGTPSWVNHNAMASGLSPRVRGNRCSCGQADEADGSIPACAGEPRSRKETIVGSTVYPRVCGGTSPSEFSANTWTGLSPRVRGNLVYSIARRI